MPHSVRNNAFTTRSQLSMGSVAQEHYFRSLISAYRRFTWILDPDFATFNDIDAWTKIRRDARIAHAIQKRMQSVGGLEWQMVPASDNEQDKAAAKIMEGLFKKMRRFNEARRKMAEAIFRGSSWAFIKGKRRPARIQGDGVLRLWWIPEELEHVDRFRFRIVRTEEGDQDDINTAWEIGNLEAQEWKRITRPDVFVRHSFDQTEDTLGYGRGLLQSIYFWWRAAEVAFTQGLVGLERWAQGLVHVGVQGMRRGSKNKNNDAIVNEWIEQMVKMKAEHVLVSDAEDKITVHDMPGQGMQFLIKFIEFIYTGIERLILTSTLPTGGGASVGSLSRAEVEERTLEETIQADRQGLSETIDESVAVLVWRRNTDLIRAALEEQGLPMAERPTFRIEQSKFSDPERNITVIAGALAAGVPLLSSEVYKAIDFTQPKEGEETIKPFSAGSPAGQLPVAQQFGLWSMLMGGNGNPKGPVREVRVGSNVETARMAWGDKNYATNENIRRIMEHLEIEAA